MTDPDLNLLVDTDPLALRDIARKALNENAQLRAAVTAAIDELDGGHRPDWASGQARARGRDPIGCCLCYPAESSWPCTGRMIADDLRVALGVQP